MQLTQNQVLALYFDWKIQIFTPPPPPKKTKKNKQKKKLNVFLLNV